MTPTTEQDLQGQGAMVKPGAPQPPTRARARRPSRSRAQLPPAAHVGPQTRSPDRASVLSAPEEQLAVVVEEVEPTHLLGCPSDPDLFEDPRLALTVAQTPLEGADLTPRARRVERYPQKHVEGHMVVIVRCIDCGAHTMIEPE